jgi:predicted dehydrogenase
VPGNHRGVFVKGANMSVRNRQRAVSSGQRAAGASRREFLGLSAVALSAGLIAGPSIARGAHASGSDVLKVGLIGCGGRGSGAAVNALNGDPHAKLVAMADVFRDRLLSARAQLKQAKPQQVDVCDDHCFVGFDGYQKVIQSGVDVVLIACTSKFHPVYLKAAVEAGKHVFVEKPHAIDPSGVHLVQQACDEARHKGLCVVSGLCWRYDKAVQETMARVLDGAIGKVVAIQESYMRSPYCLVPRRPQYSELEYQFRNWYHFNWLSGDDVPQSLLHSMDKAAWAFREETPQRAFGQGGRASSFDTVYGDVFDHDSIVYEYAGGVRMYANVRAQDGCHNEVTDTILGTKGQAYLPVRCRIEGEHPWHYESRQPPLSMYDAEHEVLFAAIRGGQPVNNGLYMVRSTMLAVMGQMVCYSGKQMTWDEAWNSPYKAGPDDCSWQMEPPTKPDKAGVYPVPVPGVSTLGAKGAYIPPRRG